MKIIRIISLCVCIMLMALPIVIAISLQLQTAIARHEMLERMEHEELVTLYLSPSEVQWHKQGKELLVGEELFDVKSFEKKGNGFIVTGLFDTKEKQLKANAEAWAKKSSSQNANKISALLQLVFCNQVPDFAYLSPTRLQCLHWSYSDVILNRPSSVIIQPPIFLA